MKTVDTTVFMEFPAGQHFSASPRARFFACNFTKLLNEENARRTREEQPDINEREV